MKKRAKVIALFLGVALVLGSLAGCGSQSTSTSKSTSKTSSAAPYQVVMAVASPFGIPQDMQAVNAAVSKITLKDIDATVQILPIQAGTWGQKVNLWEASGQKIDLLYVDPQFNFIGQVDSGYLRPLDTLLSQYGKSITSAIPSAFMAAGRVNGKIYAVPVYENYAMQNAVVMRKDLVEKYHIDVSKIHTPADLAAALKVIKTNDPTVIPLVHMPGNTQNTFLRAMNWFDPLGDYIGVLPNYNNNLKIVDLYTTPKYAQMLKMIRGWYLKGYVAADAATTQAAGPAQIKAGRAFAQLAPWMPGGTAINTMMMARPMVFAKLSPNAYVTTESLAGNMYAIPTSCKNPQKAMQFLNLLYSNTQILNLIDHGIEGKDYVKKSANVFAYPPGTAPMTGYPSWANLFGDMYIGMLENGQASDYWQVAKSFSNGAIRSKAMGFNFDASPVKTQYAAVMNVIDQYAPGLEDGSSDPTTVLPKFISALKAAGIDKVIAAKQKQLDAWAKQNQ